MVLSVIIVNYNVKHFLEQCLCSVKKAMHGIEGEIIVVDNHSPDNSVGYLQTAFPTVTFISNNTNLGFAKACNRGLEAASGEYILFLNPDTIVPEDCFTLCISFFREHPDAGALGTRMLDGSGRFLKESKRSFPSPMTSLYKLFGLSRLFPNSPVFSKYHLGNLDEHKDNAVDVLAGAFMMIKKSVLEKVGSFDEVFFMYGEDVDLSYRIQEAGYRNYYFAGSSIIHFKGESTRKGSMNYVRMFYNAMSIFVRKHYGGSKAGVFNFLIHLAIWIRAAFTALGHFIRRAGLPLIDAGLILLSFWLMTIIWTSYVKPDIVYEKRLLWIAFPAYTVFYLLTAYYAGLYDRWYKRSELVRSMLIASLVLLAAYALLPEHYRFSRGIILFGALLAFVLISILRWVLVRSGVLSSTKEQEEKHTMIIAGSSGEYDEVMGLLKKASLDKRVLGRLAVNDRNGNVLGHWKKLAEISTAVPFREIIYCEGTASFKEIITTIQDLPGGIKAKIHATGSRSIVGSDSKDSSGEAVSTEDGLNLSDPYNRRLKRLIDSSTAFLFLASFPIHLVFVKNPLRFLANCLSVLFARRTWVGYAIEEKHLPRLQPGIIACNGSPYSTTRQLPAESLHMMDYWYARDYEPTADLRLIWKSYRMLGS